MDYAELIDSNAEDMTLLASEYTSKSLYVKNISTMRFKTHNTTH